MALIGLLLIHHSRGGGQAPETSGRAYACARTTEIQTQLQMINGQVRELMLGFGHEPDGFARIRNLQAQQGLSQQARALAQEAQALKPQCSSG
jgi:hypothetical protein